MLIRFPIFVILTKQGFHGFFNQVIGKLISTIQIL